MIYIRGLVKLMNQVREKLTQSITKDDLVQIKKVIKYNLDRIQQVCFKNGIDTDNLHPPTRRAFNYLSSLNLESELKNKPSDKVSRIQIKNLNAMVKLFLNQLASVKNDNDFDLFKKDAEEYLSKIYTDFNNKKLSTKHLSVKQQRMLMRLEKYLEEPYCKLFVKNGLYIREVFEQRWNIFLLRRAEPIVFFNPSDTRLWYFKKNKQDSELFISDLFLIADDKIILDKLVNVITGRSRKPKLDMKELRKFIYGDRVDCFKNSIEELIVHNDSSAVGVVYDLNVLFDKINEKYFSSKLSKKGLSWTKTNAKCRTGYYSPSTNEIFISAALDNEYTPQYVVEFVLYHEMLHMIQHLNGELVPGRRIHTKSFKIQEREFSQYRQAEDFLKRLAVSD